jgi:serine/threonine-protein kinase
MGAVFRAVDRGARREVALKLLLRGEGSETEARLVREGHATAALSHPGIVRVHSAGACAYGPYLVYELIQGARPLSDALPEMRLSERLAAFRQVVAAVAHAHAEGVVHRDLKPANVLLGEDGDARVVEFGLGWVLEADSLTKTGEFLGSPAYMSPEQVTGTSASRAPTTDVWALGVFLYEALTGEVPFTGANLVDLAASICRGEYEPVRRHDPSLPASLERVVARCLRSEPSARYRDAGALLAALARGEAPARSGQRWYPLAGLVSAGNPSLRLVRRRRPLRPRRRRRRRTRRLRSWPALGRGPRPATPRVRWRPSKRRPPSSPTTRRSSSCAASSGPIREPCERRWPTWTARWSWPHRSARPTRRAPTSGAARATSRACTPTPSG